MPIALILCLLLVFSPAAGAQPTRAEALQAMRKAAEFYSKKVSREGGYHFHYTSDLTYGRSEQSEGLSKAEVQREATPMAAMAYLDAFAATKDQLFLDAAKASAHALVRGQICSGGWDYFIEFDQAQRGKYPYRADGRCTEPAAMAKPGVTTLDDNVSQAALRVLMRVDRELKFEDKAIHDAALFALDRLMAVQYPIGAWPQRFERPADFAQFPVKQASYPESWPWKWPGADYRHHYTFNDNSISDMIDAMLEAARIYQDPRYLASAEKGGEFMLRAQMPAPQPAWAQQYDADMRPAWARQFEPPSVTGGESIGIMRTLMVLYRETGNRKYLDPIPRAIDYLKASVLARKDAEIFRRIPEGEPVLARFYELKTNRPLYVTKGMMVNAPGLGSRRPDGYELSYSPDSVITHYGVLVSGRGLGELERDCAALLKANPQSLRRGERLTGLSPWSQRLNLSDEPDRRSVPPSAVKRIIDALDDRGAWTRTGSIGKADKVVSVFASKDMVLRIRRGRSEKAETIPISENDTVELFLGKEQPPETIITTADFARNLDMLGRYFASASQ